MIVTCSTLIGFQSPDYGLVGKCSNTRSARTLESLRFAGRQRTLSSLVELTNMTYAIPAFHWRRAEAEFWESGPQPIIAGRDPTAEVLSREEEKTIFRQFSFARHATRKSLQPAHHAGDWNARRLNESHWSEAIAWGRRALECRAILAAWNVRYAWKLAHALAGRLNAGGANMVDDVKGICSVELLAAISRYDWRRGLKFSTYLSNRVSCGVYHAAVKETPQAQSDDRDSVADTIADDSVHDPELQDQRADQVTALLEHLTPIQREVITMRFGLNGQRATTLVIIAAKLGYCKWRIVQIEREALAIMRDRAAPVTS